MLNAYVCQYSYGDVGFEIFTLYKLFFEVFQATGFLHAVLDVWIKLCFKLQETRK